MWTVATILLILLAVWLMFEAWRAPHYIQDENGNYKRIGETKKFSDILKKLKK